MFRPPSTSTALLTFLVCGACSMTGPVSPPASSFQEGEITQLEVQALVMEMADDYDAALGETTYLVLREGEVDATARWLALSFLRNGMGASLDIASGPNPDVALLDLLVLGTLQTWAFETHWIPAGIDTPSGDEAVARLRAAEERMWDSARRVLSAEHEQTLRELTPAWIEEHPEQTVVSFVRFDDFAQGRQLSTAAGRGRASGLLRDVSAASAAVEDARLFGERARWFAARYPYILGQQAELTSYRMLDQPEVRDGLAALSTLSRSSEALAAQMEGMFQQVREERVRTIEQLSDSLSQATTEALEGLERGIERARIAAVDHFFNRVDSQLEDFFVSLDAARKEVRALVEETHATALASAQAGRALTETGEAFDHLAERFDRDAVDGREPLRLSDLRETAVAANDAALHLNELFARAEATLGSADWDQRIAALDTSAGKLANAFFWRGLGLVGLLLAGLALVRRFPVRR